jgi:hypothetical protein
MGLVPEPVSLLKMRWPADNLPLARSGYVIGNVNSVIWEYQPYAASVKKIL